METSIDLVKRIVIKLPFDLQERILTFPFLHAVSEYYPKAELHFITPQFEIEVLNLLPFKAFYHPFDENEIANVFDAHRYCANAKIYNVDIFISLTNSLADAFLGVALRAKKRVGFADNWKTVFLTDKMIRPNGQHLNEDFMALFRILVGPLAKEKLKINSRTLTPILKDETPYIAINVSPLRHATLEQEWIDLINLFDGQKIVLFASQDQVKVQMVIEPFLKLLPSRNTYMNFAYKDYIDLARMLAHATGTITYAGPAGALSAYVGTKTLVLYENEDPQKTGPFYFLADVAVMGVNDPTLVNSVKDLKLLKDRKTFDMLEVFKKAHEFFRLN